MLEEIENKIQLFQVFNFLFKPLFSIIEICPF